MRWVLLACALVACFGANACGDDTHHRATTTDETFTSSVGDEDVEDEEEAESQPEGEP